MSKKDIQKQFDYAVGQVIKQGQQAYSVKDGCTYRLKKGNAVLKCPIGWLIPDSYFKTHPTHITNTFVDDLSPSVYSYARMAPFKKNQGILRNLQSAHDDAALYFKGSEFLNEFKEEAREVANFHKLKWNFE
jgi:hypothetical protein